MKTTCYISLGSIYIVEASLGHGVVYVALALVYALLAYSEWIHSNHQFIDHSSAPKGGFKQARTDSQLG